MKGQSVRNLIKILSALVLAGAGFLVAPHAFAYSYADMCESSAGNQHCWRTSSAHSTDGIFEWPRDISGDPLQRTDVFYDGTIGSFGCPAAASSNLDPNTGVWDFGDANGYLTGAGYYSSGRYYLGEDRSGATHWYDYWAWTATGFLVNCGDNANGGLYVLCHVPDYAQLATGQGCVATWTVVKV